MDGRSQVGRPRAESFQVGRFFVVKETISPGPSDLMQCGHMPSRDQEAPSPALSQSSMSSSSSTSSRATGQLVVPSPEVRPTTTNCAVAGSQQSSVRMGNVMAAHSVAAL
mmetsp:Transcript_20308/g.53633  ORF Transcript_20308/g.53633 Transcript_20308/m.53633 type:complete len:110 (+) Transcript_20308:94-423(+)